MHLALRRISVAGVALRPATAGDEPFLAALYATTRADELALTDWDEEKKAAFCASQFRLQQLDYSSRFPAEGHSIVLRGGEPVGRVWTAPQEDHLLLVDIAILPEHRGEGIGTAVLGRIVEDAAGAKTPVRVMVLRTKARALVFYRRLGFTLRAEDAVFLLLERRV